MKAVKDYQPCKECKGEGFIGTDYKYKNRPFTVTDICERCNGHGEVVKSRTINVSQQAVDDTNEWLGRLKNE